MTCSWPEWLTWRRERICDSYSTKPQTLLTRRCGGTACRADPRVCGPHSAAGTLLYQAVIRVIVLGARITASPIMHVAFQNKILRFEYEGTSDLHVQ
jgi:hypothetical protein